MTPNRAQLKWRCRRGMRELDAALVAFVDSAAFATLDDDDIARFERILELPDPELHAYLLGRSEPADRNFARLFELVRTALRPPA